MMWLVVLIGAVASLNVALAATCNINCPANQDCYATSTDAMNCLQSMPINQVWANATLDVLMQSLENFGFSALYHNTGPPYSISMDIEGELATALELVNQGKFAIDLDFQEYVQKIFQKTIDAHTRYSKPYCYNATFLQPFAFNMQLIKNESTPIANEPRLFTMSNLYTETYKTIYPNLANDVDAIIGQEILLLNGLEFMTEITTWGDNYETRSNNRGVRFNSAYRSYLYRSAVSFNILPLQDLTVTLVDGRTFTFPWMSIYRNGLADLSYCAAKTAELSSIKDEDKKKEVIKTQNPISPRIPISDDPENHRVHQLHDDILHASRPDRKVIIPSNNTYYVSCFIQTISTTDLSKEAGVKKVLVMKVASFSPPGEYQVAWENFLENAATCITAENYDYDMIIVDVMQNGGGYVCLGLRLIEFLVEDYEKDHKLVQMNYDLVHSPLMDRYIEVVNAPNPYPDPADVEQILDPATQESYPDGKAYYYPGRNVTQGGVVNWRTNFFALDCREAEAMPYNGSFTPAKFMPKDRLVILTDGTCGSTCASFTKIPQEADKATFVGAGGIWDENMDVSSFAGGFVCNPTYLQNIAIWSNTTFPSFLTYQRWQFGWATWYSKKLPSRQVQFTEQTPIYRSPFWGFPHVSISSTETTVMVSQLYDEVITSTMTRLAATNMALSDSSDDSCLFDEGSSVALLILVILFGSIILFSSGIFYYYYYYNPTPKRKNSLTKYGIESDNLMHSPAEI